MGQIRAQVQVKCEHKGEQVSQSVDLEFMWALPKSKSINYNKTIMRLNHAVYKYYTLIVILKRYSVTNLKAQCVRKLSRSANSI